MDGPPSIPAVPAHPIDTPRAEMSASLINAAIGEYRIVDRLGEGGMGEVYRAVHSKIGRVAAVKVMSQAVSNPEFVERFLNEARIQARLKHPNVATLYDFLEFQGRPCIIMEYVEGQTLADLIRIRGALPRHESIPIFRAVVDALSYVHGQGVIHRDIKSTNVKITPAGEVKLLDFGIAKSGSSPSLTVTGGFVGTLQYTSPEQFTGGAADARSDIWALGVLLYEMSTGRLPFDASSIGGLYEKINAATYPPPSAVNAYVPREVEAMITRCLRRNPAERYQSARDLLLDMNRMMTVVDGAHAAVAIAAAPFLAAPTYKEAPPVRPTTSQPPAKLPLIIAAGVITLIGVGGGIYFIAGGGADTPSPAGAPVQQPAKPPTPSLRRPDPAGPETKVFTLEVSEGQADVFKDGAKVGVTPYQFPAKPGEQVNLVLKRDGYADKPVQLSVSENKKVYTFSLSRKE